jgi:hypothetical protein
MVVFYSGQGEEWPTDGTAHLGRDAWELAKERLRIPKRLGGLGLTDVKMSRGKSRLRY